MMGAGKTTIAAELGRVLDRRFVDLDQEIERRANRSVSEIFRESGESEFRRLELEAFLALSSAGFDVLALGGGAFLSEPLRRGISSSDASSIYLHATVDQLCERLASLRATRPLIAGSGWEEVLREMYEFRDPVYRLADRVVETGARSVGEIANEVIDAVSI